MSTVYRVAYLNNSLGELGRLPDNAIVNIGGTSSPSFTVGGKPLMFADGTSTGPGANAGFSLQAAYSNGTDGTINLTADKHFILTALNTQIFAVDANTGKVTITGDLEVRGSSTVVEGTIANVDQIQIAPPNSTTTALLIEPQLGVTLSTNLVTFKTQFGGSPAFNITGAGVTEARTLTVADNLTVGGTINGINLSSFYSAFQTHISTPGVRHPAGDISTAGPFTTIGSGSVEQVLSNIDSLLTANANAVRTYRHNQVTAVLVWTITHNKNSDNVTATIYDNTGEQVWADRVRIIDLNTIEVSFNTAMAGYAVLLMF